MRVQTEDWQRFIPGVRNYKGKKTLFYNGEELVYDWEEIQTWEAIIVLPGVDVIPAFTLQCCRNVKIIIMSDTVTRIEKRAFHRCRSLVYIRLSRNLEYIGEFVFRFCDSLTSIFIPPSCTEIGVHALSDCGKLIILSVPHHTQLGENVIGATALIEASPFETDRFGDYENQEDVKTWIKNQLQGDEYALHRACSSLHPLEESIYGIVRRKGLKAFKKPDSVGVTPLQYLEQNPFADMEEQSIMKRYILDIMGEIVS